MEVKNNVLKIGERKFKISSLVILAETAAIIGLGIALASTSSKLKADEEYIAVEAQKVYEYYDSGDYVSFNDYTYGDVILKAVDGMPRCTYDYSNLETDGCKKYYSENGDVISKLGVDVSYFQGDIDWEAVKADGIDFVMIRAGYRGYETGLVNTDSRFEEYISGALAADLEVGVYFYSQAVNADEAEEEAEYVVSLLEPYDITYPVVYDWEIVGEESARTNEVTAAELTECSAKFCSVISKAGYKPMIYTNKRQALLKTDLNVLGGIDHWIAEYTDTPSFPYEFQMWQYASDAVVDGIEGDVDINLSFVDYTSVR